ncbi:MAG: MazG-like family protein [bacterium]|nr:MazG-like family protein [bacterium]
MKTSQEIIKKFMEERGWEKQLPDQVAKSISIEAAELLELFQWTNPSVREVKGNPELFKELQSELADVFIYCLEMAIIFNLDVHEIIKVKLAHAAKKYPAELIRIASEGAPLANQEYLKIKKAYRKRKING